MTPVPDNVVLAAAQRMDELTQENDSIRAAQMLSDMKVSAALAQTDKRLRAAEQAIDRLSNAVQGLMTLQGSTK